MDGKRGHENQTAGLCDRLGRLQPDLQVFELTCEGSLWQRLPLQGRHLPSPDVLLGAGHRTHVPLLWGRRQFGGRTVVLMKPTLPVHWFDLAFVPRHDPMSDPSANVVRTIGVINRVTPPSGPKENIGLILIGGPSKLFEWSDDLWSQVREAIECDPALHWIITNSRRTPASAREAMDRLKPLADVVYVEETDADWVPRHLARAKRVWVTEDSVSMVFEAITSRATVGLLTLPCRNPAHRVAREIKRLESEGMVTRNAQAPAPSKSSIHLWEADRCARILLERLFMSN